MIIEHDNIIYMSDIPNVGGTSTYVLELAKRYKDRDIAIVYKTCQNEMIIKLAKYCRVYRLHPEDKIKCKVIVINCDSSVCNQIIKGNVYLEHGDYETKEGIIDNMLGKTYMTMHADYSNPIYKGTHPRLDDRIDEYISITKVIQKWLKNECGKDSQVIYNPLTIEKTEKPIIIMSATRMSNEKGRKRTIELANAMNRKGINFLWFIFTPNEDDINVPNVIYMKSRTDMERFMWMADYGAQLSDSEGLSYTINEFLYRNIPVLTTPLPYLEEIGYKDGETGYIVNFDCSNVDEVAEKIKNIPRFKFEKLNDNYDDIFVEGVSHYKEGEDMKKVKVIRKFDDIVDKIRRKKDEVFIVDNARADYLRDIGLVNIIEVIEEKKIEKAVKEEKKENTKKVKKVAKK